MQKYLQITRVLTHSQILIHYVMIWIHYIKWLLILATSKGFPFVHFKNIVNINVYLFKIYSQSDIPNFEIKYPIKLNTPDDVDIYYNHEFILEQQMKYKDQYNKDDLILLNQWINDDKHPSIKYFVADIRYILFSNIYNIHS